MGQSNFVWLIVYDNATTATVVSTAENLSDVVDFCSDIVAIIRIGFAQ